MDVNADRNRWDLDRLLDDARAEVPEGLAARLVAGARSASAQRTIFWADVERTARRALAVAAAAAVVTIALAVSTVVVTSGPDNIQTAALVDPSGQLEAYEEAP
jgi:hypothetical protein